MSKLPKDLIAAIEDVLDEVSIDSEEKEKPSLTEKIEVADEWINNGYSISKVLKIIKQPVKVLSGE